MSNLGIGAMLHKLGGGSPKSASDYYGRKIKDAYFYDDAIILTFDDGIKVKIWDDGQSCCEHRYITCDDNIQDLIGGILHIIEVKDMPYVNDEYETHEQCGLEIRTDKAFVNVVTHNEHNGYYGGFGLSLDEIK